MNKYSALISDFLHNCGEADKGFVNDTEWWIVNGSVKVQIFLTSLEEDAELIVAATLFRYTRSNPDLNEYVLKLNGTFKLKGVSFGIRNKHLFQATEAQNGFVQEHFCTFQLLLPTALEWIVDR